MLLSILALLFLALVVRKRRTKSAVPQPEFCSDIIGVEGILVRLTAVSGGTRALSGPSWTLGIRIPIATVSSKRYRQKPTNWSTQDTAVQCLSMQNSLTHRMLSC